MTEVYFFDRGDEQLPSSALALLPPWRRKRLETLRNPLARQESIAAGLLLSFVMEQHDIAPYEPVDFLPAGKPVFSRRGNRWFSLSHSGRYAMCAVGDQSVGADVQQLRPVKLSIARRFHHEERDWLSRQRPEEQTAALFRLWTRKEAWVKAESDERILSLSETDVIHVLPGWRFQDYAPASDYCGAVCARQGETPKEPFWVSREELLSLRHEG